MPGPSSIWLDAEGNRLAAPNFPGFDTVSTLEAIQNTGYSYSWFILNQKIIEREFALSGSEQNPDLTGKSLKKVLKRSLPGAPKPIQAFMDKGEDFIIASNLDNLVIGMNRLTKEKRLHVSHIEKQIRARDREMDNRFTKDAQVTAIRGARYYTGDRLIRVAGSSSVIRFKKWTARCCSASHT
ncbi:hypothetical protein J32TS6_23900 [Virgibacillus pantothenticus]|nr:hypothetical protein J32TS6_23900 [Virgibacillus pantothenticus]